MAGRKDNDATLRPLADAVRKWAGEHGVPNAFLLEELLREPERGRVRDAIRRRPGWDYWMTLADGTAVLVSWERVRVDGARGERWRIEVVEDEDEPAAKPAKGGGR